MEILVIGGGCADCDKVYAEAQAAVGELGMNATVRKVEDLVEMVRLGVMSVPALMWMDGCCRQGAPSIKARSCGCWDRKWENERYFET